MNIDAINQLDGADLESQLLTCCHCNAWAKRVAGARPFPDAAELTGACVVEWGKATEEEILEAFSGHPQIGDLTALRNKYAATAGAEQGQVTEADESILLALRDRNAEYLERFGFIFIVCATGKSASEMLSLLESRIGNSRSEELINGAREQREIMKLRLAKLLEDD